MNRRRRVVAVAIIGVLLSVGLAGCDVARANTRCRAAGSWARDSTFVLHCVKGRWTRSITIAQYVQLLLRNSTTTTAPAPATPPASPVPPPDPAPVTTDPPPTTTTIPSNYVQKVHRSTFLASFTGQFQSPDTATWTSGPVAVSAGPGSTCSIVGTPTASILPSYPLMSVSVLVTWVDLVGDGPEGHLACMHSDSIGVTTTGGATAQAKWYEDSE